MIALKEVREREAAAEAAGSNQTAFNLLGNLSALNETALNLVSNLTSGMPEFSSGEWYYQDAVTGEPIGPISWDAARAAAGGLAAVGGCRRGLAAYTREVWIGVYDIPLFS